MNFERLPPHDVDAEEAVVGSLLVDNSVMPEVFMTLKPADFFTSQCKWIYETCCTIYENHVNITQITVAHELLSKGKLEEIGGAAYLSQLVAQCPTSVFVGDYARVVKDCSVNRQLIRVANQVAEMGYDNTDPPENLAKAYALLQRIQHDQEPPAGAKELSKEAADYYGSLRTVSAGIATGLSLLDNKLGGLLKGESIVLCGNTSVGKTSLAVQIARYIATTRKVFIASEEMTKQDLINKMVAQISGVHSELIALGNYPDERIDRMFMALSTVSSLKFHIGKVKTTAMLRSAIERYEPEFVVVDYLQKLRDRLSDSDVQRIGFIAHELTGMSKDFNVPILVLSQLHRSMEEKKNKKPRMSDLRGSGEIEESFDSVWGLWRESYTAFLENKKAEAGDTTELWILKNRLRGNRGKITLEWDQNFECYKRGYNE